MYRLGYKEAVALGVIVPTKLCASNTTEAYLRYAAARDFGNDEWRSDGLRYGQTEAAELLVTALEVRLFGWPRTMGTLIWDVQSLSTPHPSRIGVRAVQREHLLQLPPAQPMGCRGLR